MLNISEIDGTMLVNLEGEIDHHITSKIRIEIDDAVREIKPQKLILDFSTITFMDSSGIGLVAGRFKTMRELGGSVELIGVSKHIAKVMSLSGIDKLATVTPAE
ncbi:MAG: anti-sigma factor antagonist [Oscillospiraceae bacterium]|jgi:stage II sporulation protein AA (anti-sigma F factor antagonist)|nr:anti-sigma factor antagonist [Oscillospiraceae bacterium]